MMTSVSLFDYLLNIISYVPPPTIVCVHYYYVMQDFTFLFGKWLFYQFRCVSVHIYIILFLYFIEGYRIHVFQSFTFLVFHCDSWIWLMVTVLFMSDFVFQYLHLFDLFMRLHPYIMPHVLHKILLFSLICDCFNFLEIMLAIY